MLTVLPIQSKDTQKELCDICGVTYNENAFSYRADDGDFIGICQFPACTSFDLKLLCFFN